MMYFFHFEKVVFHSEMVAKLGMWSNYYYQLVSNLNDWILDSSILTWIMNYFLYDDFSSNFKNLEYFVDAGHHTFFLVNSYHSIYFTYFGNIVCDGTC